MGCVCLCRGRLLCFVFVCFLSVLAIHAFVCASYPAILCACFLNALPWPYACFDNALATNPSQVCFLGTTPRARLLGHNS